MRLLLRASAHRQVDGGVEIAASPDTPRREAWQWHVRVVENGRAEGGCWENGRAEGGTGGGTDTITLALPRVGGAAAVLEVASDAGASAATADVFITGAAVTLERDQREVLVLIVGQGMARVEGRHLLGELDALVLEGDDPLSVSVEREGDAPTSVAMVRLRSTGGRAFGWVP